MSRDDLVEVVDRLAEDDELVLQCIDQGLDDVRKITDATRLNKDMVNNRYDKLSDLGLIEVGESEGMVEGFVDGKRQMYREPKDAWLTDRGREAVELLEENRVEEYRSLSRDELAAKIVELENEVSALHNRIDALKKDMQAVLYDRD